jgi:hypothetical protein
MTAPLRWGAALLSALVALAMPGCASEQRKPPRAPALGAPNDAVPPDLDLVIRLDLGRIRAGLGPEAVRGLRENAFEKQAAGADDAWVADAIEQSDTALVALRPELGTEGPDNVIVLSGRFAGLAPLVKTPPGWRPPIDLGADVRRFDRKLTGSRASPARLYAFGDRELVLVSVAEIDSVEAVLERGRPASPLRPKASGLLSFQARLRDARRLLEGRFPILGRLLGSARSLAGVVDVTGDTLTTDLGLELAEETHATEAASALDRLAKELAKTDGRAGVIAENAKVQAAGRFIGIRLNLGWSELAGLFRAGGASTPGP